MARKKPRPPEDLDDSSNTSAGASGTPDDDKPQPSGPVGDPAGEH